MRSRQRYRLERLLVASDGEPAADAALVLAKLLAERDGADVEVVGVFSPHIPVPPMAAGSSEHRCEPRDQKAVAELLERLRQQTRVRVSVPWPVHLRVGPPPGMICDMARSRHASIVLLGHTTPGESRDRRTRRHTAAQISFGCDVPVLTVPPGMNCLPRTAVVVVDDSEASQRALSMAATILANDGNLHETGGPVTPEVLHLSEALGADLVSLPLPGQTAAVRSLLGGGVADVLDHARCSVLITPSATAGAPVVPDTHRSVQACR